MRKAAVGMGSKQPVTHLWMPPVVREAAMQSPTYLHDLPASTLLALIGRFTGTDIAAEWFEA
ncbi:hypothetical protein GCM10020220_071610 [Nonomuraea rubra]